MSHGQPAPSQSDLRSHWNDLLRQWEEKRFRYEQLQAQNKDPTLKIQLEVAIKTCNDVIQTCHGLIQSLPATNSESAPKPNTPKLLSSPENPTPKKFDADQTSESLLTIAQHLLSDSQEIDQVVDKLSDSHQANSASFSQETDPNNPSLTLFASKLEFQRGLKQILGGVLPVLLIAAGLVAIFRPRNVCTIAPDGTYSSTGLALRVDKALKESTNSASLNSIAVAQYGCTIVLKGTVPNQSIESDLVAIAKNIEIPDQSPKERFKRKFNWGESKFVKPVAEVISEIKVDPRLSQSK